MPAISVIIPVYNAEKYLERCLDSVCNQTLRDIEIICVNDYSTDDSLNILNSYVKQYPNIKLINCDHNGGESIARNIGIANASGDYIGFVDNDDKIDLDFYEKLYRKAIETNADIVKGNVIEIKYDGTSICRKTNEKIHLSNNKMLFYGDWWSAIYRRDLIFSNNIKLLENYPLGADSMFVYKALLLADSLELVNDSYYYYIRREDSGASKILSIEKIKSFLTIIQMIIDDANQRDLSLLSEEAYNVVFAHFFEILATIPYQNKSDEAISIASENLFSFYNKYKYDKATLFNKGTLLYPFDYLQNALNQNVDKTFDKIKEFSKYKTQVLYQIRKKNITTMKNGLPIPIFLASDNNYAPFISTTIASICDNTKNDCIFYILDNGITKENRDKIKDLNNIFDNFSIEFIAVDSNFEFRNLCDTKMYSKSMYNRFLIPYLKPDIDKAIYSDVDVIVYGDIQEMYLENLEGYALGAVWEDFFEKSLNIQRKKNLDLASNHRYFSSGNLLFDCKKWREENILAKLLDLGEKYKNVLKWPDQDILNKYFACNYKQLDRKYCFTDLCYEYSNPKFLIRHYTGLLKPWKISPNLKSSLFPDTQRFWYYAKVTPFYRELLNSCLVKTQEELLIWQVKMKYQKIMESKKEYVNAK